MSEHAERKQPATKPLTPGLLMPVSLREIDNGRLMKRVTNAIQQAAVALESYSKASGDSRGTATIALKIQLSKDPDMPDQTVVTYGLSRKIPEPKGKTICKTKDGRLLTEATPDAVKARAGETDQIELFDFMGGEQGAVDPKTGQVTEERDTAGSIKPA